MKAAPRQEEPPAAQERKGISEDDPLVQRIRADVLRDTGVELDQLLNPSKVRRLGGGWIDRSFARLIGRSV